MYDEKEVIQNMISLSTPVRIGEFDLADIEQNFGLISKSRDQSQLFQDTLNKIYIDAKRKDLSQTIFTTFTNIDEIDGERDGHVEV